MSNPRDPEYVNFGLSAARIAAELADGKRDYFAGNPGITMQRRTELEAELATIKLRREEYRVAHSDAYAAAKRSQFAILVAKLQEIGLGYLVEQAREEAEDQKEVA